MNKNFKGSEFHRFLRKIRTRLDEILKPMSIKRAHKESIALQMVTLPQFIRYAKENSWPKWLKKKSYYRECNLFFLVFTEASTGKKIPEHIILESIKQYAIKATPKKNTRKRKYKKKSSSGPAFADKKRGSIFGLKK